MNIDEVELRLTIKLMIHSFKKESSKFYQEDIIDHIQNEKETSLTYLIASNKWPFCSRPMFS